MQKVIENAITSLQKTRLLFHSEDDLKFSLSMALSSQLCDEFEIRLEWPRNIKMTQRDGGEIETRASIDLVIFSPDKEEIYPIELKYKTEKFEAEVGREAYMLAKHGATDCGRYSFRKDIFRLEKLLADDKVKQAFFLVLTNDAKYLEDVSHKDTLDANYSFHQDACLPKNDEGWSYKKSGYIVDEITQRVSRESKLHWTSRGEYFYQLDLNFNYNIEWQEYSKVSDQVFHLALIEISPSNNSPDIKLSK